MNWIDKLERRYGNLGIPYLINGLMIGQLAAGLIVLLFDWKFASMISLSRISVLQGQIWRLVTFLFQPIWLGGVLGVLNLVFYFWIGNALTRVWGDFRMTLFMALGVLGAWVGCFLTGSAGPSAIFQSMLFAYTWLWPDQMVLLFGIGLVNAAIYNGDVLTYYALFGLLMIPIGKLPNRWVWVIAALLFIQPLELWQYFSGHTLSIRGIEGMETLYPTLATGTFAESARVSLLYGPLSSFGWGLEHGRGTQTLLMFVLGMLAGRYRLFYDEGQHRRI